MITSVRTCADCLFCSLLGHGKSPYISRSCVLGFIGVGQQGLVSYVVDVGVFDG
jgi:hypothetical protein